MDIVKITDDIIDEIFEEVMPQLSNPHPLYQKFVDSYSEEEIAALINASKVTVKHPIFSHEESIKFHQLVEKMRQASKLSF